MKRSMSILLVLILVLTTVVTFTPKAFSDDSGVVPDLVLRVKINRELGLGNGNTSPVTRAQVESLTNLNANSNLNYSEPKITSLEGLQYATNLNSLSFCANQVSDISVLSGLTSLTKLDFYDNQVSDISALSDLTNLQDLNFSINQVSDISVLSGLTNLKSLSFSNNQVSDLTPISGLTDLEWLSFDGNRVTDLTPIRNIVEEFNTFVIASSQKILMPLDSPYEFELEVIGLHSETLEASYDGEEVSKNGNTYSLNTSDSELTWEKYYSDSDILFSITLMVYESEFGDVKPNDQYLLWLNNTDRIEFLSADNLHILDNIAKYYPGGVLDLSSVSYIDDAARKKLREMFAHNKSVVDGKISSVRFNATILKDNYDSAGFKELLEDMASWPVDKEILVGPNGLGRHHEMMGKATNYLEPYLVYYVNQHNKVFGRSKNPPTLTYLADSFFATKKG